MDILGDLIFAVPAMVAEGMLDRTGGALAAREENGIYISPQDAGPLDGWDLAPDDFVLFPGGGEASMARAGRRPCINSRLHRAALSTFDKWNYTIETTLPALMAFAYAARGLALGPSHAAILDLPKTSVIRPAECETGPIVVKEESFISALADSSGSGKSGAVLLPGTGLFAGSDSLDGLRALLRVLEKAAQAQLWRLSS